MTEPAPVRFIGRPYGDAALLVHVEAPGHEQRWAAALALAQHLRTFDDVTDVLATYEDVFAAFDPRETDVDAIASRVSAFVAPPPVPASGVLHEMPVAYGGEFGPDLDAVAAELGLAPRELIALHTSIAWTVRFTASPLGAPFLEGPRFPAPVRRLGAPRSRVPAGSVGISGQQTTIYNASSPGGWRLIGRTPVSLFDLQADPPVAYAPGDAMRFVAIPHHELAAHDGRRP